MPDARRCPNCGASAAPTVQVTVRTAADPVAIAREVERVMRRYGRGHQ